MTKSLDLVEHFIHLFHEIVEKISPYMKRSASGLRILVNQNLHLPLEEHVEYKQIKKASPLDRLASTEAETS